MSMAKLVRTLLIEREMRITDIAKKLGTSTQNISGKLRRDNFSEKELRDIAEVCNATFTAGFILNDTGKEIK